MKITDNNIRKIGRLRWLYPTLTDEEILAMFTADEPKSEEPANPLQGLEGIDVVAPVSSVTGWRSNDLRVFFAADVTPQERAVILARIGEMGNAPAAETIGRMSDDEAISLVPSRYAQSLASSQEYKNFLLEVVGRTVDDVNAAKAAKTAVDPAKTSVEPKTE